jgi:hypothetical protein
MIMADRDTGEDKTDAKRDRELVEEALEVQNRMPFFEAVRPIHYAPGKED